MRRSGCTRARATPARVRHDAITREGSLEAPTRHPIDWRNPDYYDQASGEKELERIFDICHGCRRCVSLCNAFPTLFDLDRRGQDRRGRRRREGGLRQGRRPVLPVRPLLHDQVSVRSAASVERRFPAPDAAREGAEVPARRDEVCATACSPAPTGWASSPRSRSSSRSVNKANETPLARKAMESAARRAPRAPAAALRAEAASRDRAEKRRLAGAGRRAHARARSRSSRPATSTTTSPASAST